MKCTSCFYIFIFVCLSGVSQDTVRIRNIKNFQAGKTNFLISPNGKLVEIKVLPRAENWELEGAMEEEGLMLPEAGNQMVDPNLTPDQKERIRQNACVNARFAGLSRSKVKTTVTRNQPRTYTSLPQFLNTLFPDTDMKVVVRALSKPYAQRAIQEDKMVTLKNVFLLAYAREEDNDYHLIITNSSRSIFFNAELSALPANSASSYQMLKAVRSGFENFPGGVNCGNYTFLVTPMKISTMTGSLFFDIDHPAGRVGPLGARPATAWEIHPVTAIKFE